MPSFTSIGVPTETKTDEHRVALTPDGVVELVARGVRVAVQSGAGTAAGFEDASYQAVGAIIVADAADAWSCELVVKVKEPQAAEFTHLRPDLTLFTYLHLAAYPEVAEALTASGCTAFAYETVTDQRGGLPLLAPMSEIAGRLATQMGAQFLAAHHGGRGVLLGGSPGVRPGRVVVIGAGNVGWNAARMAAGLEAEVVVVDRDLDRLRWVDQVYQGRVTTAAANRGSIARAVGDADLVVGAVLVAGDRAPVVVDEEMVASMRAGSVIVDVAVDQGGCIATTRETTHSAPTFLAHDVIHYAVGNMPGAVPHTSTLALTNATLPYIGRLIDTENPTSGLPADLLAGLNVSSGHVVNEIVASSLN